MGAWLYILPLEKKRMVSRWLRVAIRTYRWNDMGIDEQHLIKSTHSDTHKSTLIHTYTPLQSSPFLFKNFISFTIHYCQTFRYLSIFRQNMCLDYQIDLRFSQSHFSGKNNIWWTFREISIMWCNYDVISYFCHHCLD